MSVQIFLEGKLLGIDEFLLGPAGGNPDQVFLGRSHWISLLSEVLPRALLAELGLAKILLGSSGGGQFLFVLPEESREGAEAFLAAAASEIASLAFASSAELRQSRKTKQSQCTPGRQAPCGVGCLRPDTSPESFSAASDLDDHPAVCRR